MALAFSLVVSTLVVTTPALPARAAVCTPQPGKDGAANTLTGTYNTYYKPPLGTVAAGATSLNLGTIDTSSGGASTAVTVNDLLLVMQMQSGTFVSTNSSAYGGIGLGTGYTSIGSAGLYEYVYVTAVAGSTATIVGANAGGLINSYTNAAATGSTGQYTYQIVRVPQFLTATLGSSFSAAYWNGATGGVAALDIASTTNLAGASIYAVGNGFRGGGYTKSSTSPTSVLNTDFTGSVLMNGAAQPAFGTKGEGFLGTPQYVFYYTSFTTPSTPGSPTAPTPAPVANGYPGGDKGMGSPGNAGGGGTDEDPASNDQNTGGGGGSNGGAGGNGGYPWTPNYTGNTSQYSNPGVHAATGYSTANTADVGGRGAAAIKSGDIGPTRALMGGGGGAGSNNDGTNNNTANAFGSSGGVGGGIVLLRIAQTSGAGATIYSNGTTGLAPVNDGGGGGGAGGTVIVTSPAAFTGISVDVSGAAGTTADSAGSFPGNQHGPGGGGGGGVVISSSSVSVTSTGGVAGTTTPSLTTYGAANGSPGVSQLISASQIPGVASGAECYSSGGSLFTGPIGNNAGSGSYDGSVPTTNNNDFTAVSFIPSGSTPINSGTVPGTPIGNVLTGTATIVNVPNEFVYTGANTNTAAKRTVTFTINAPLAPAGWTAQVCPDNGSNAPSCATTGLWTAVGTAGATSTSTYGPVPKNTSSGTIKYWAVYSAPSGVTAFNRYDATISATDANTPTPNVNATHNELYTGYVVLTKTATVLSTNCPGLPPAGTACPGGVIKYAIDYRNIMVGGASEASMSPSPLLSTSKTTTPFSITDNGTGSWGVNSNGLMDTLVASANGSTTFGDTTAGSTFTNGTVGSKNFTCLIGGPSASLVAPGVTGTSQGTLYYRITIK